MPFTIAPGLSRVESPETVVKSTPDRYGRVDALLNIAGAGPQIDLFEMIDEQWHAGMELKLYGARRLAIRAWDALKASKGSVVFMSGSVALSADGWRRGKRCLIQVGRDQKAKGD